MHQKLHNFEEANSQQKNRERKIVVENSWQKNHRRRIAIEES
jgi:hypothetical protein